MINKKEIVATVVAVVIVIVVIVGLAEAAYWAVQGICKLMIWGHQWVK